MATVLALVALCLSVASITWQITSFMLTGARVKVEYSYGIGVGGLEHLPNCLTITARNVGRFAATVRSVGLEVTRDGQHAVINYMFVVTVVGILEVARALRSLR